MEDNKAFEFSVEHEKKFQDTLKKYPTKMAALLPTLWIAMAQSGYLSDEILEYIAGRLDLSPVHVLSVAEFYTMYMTTMPGKYHLQLCRNVSCTLSGAEDILAHLADEYAIYPGEVTDDGVFSLELVECLGSCGTAPVMRVNDIYCESLTIKKVDKIIEDCKAGVEPEEEPMGIH